MATDRAVLKYALTISRYDVWVADSTPMSRKDRGNGTPHPHPFLPRHGVETGYLTDVLKKKGGAHRNGVIVCEWMRSKQSQRRGESGADATDESA